MRIGLLWYDDDPKRGVEDKVRRAAERYLEKHGRWPNTCYVHAEAGSAQADGDRQVTCGSMAPGGKIRLVPAPNILRHHYWVGESTEQAGGRAKCAASLVA